MPYDYEIQYTSVQDMNNVVAISRLHVKAEDDDLVVVAMASFEKPGINVEQFRVEMISCEIARRSMNENRSRNWKN